MDKATATARQQKALTIALIIALVFGAYFLRRYFGLVAFALIVTFLFNPVFQWFLKKTKRPSTAATLTFFTALLAVIIPVTLAIILMIFQVESIAHSVQNQVQDVDFTALGTSVIDSINNLLASIPEVTFRLTPDNISEGISKLFQSLGASLIRFVTESMGSVFEFITMSVIFVFVFYALLINQDSLLAKVKALNPLGGKSSDLYLSKVSAMTKAMVRGQFIIAFLQGFASAGVLAIAGLGDLFFFFAVLLTLLSIIPLGAGIVTIPIGIIMILTGNVWQGVMIIAAHLLVITNIDNFLRPYLVPQEARLNPALTIISVFAGLAMFGFLGIVIGPVIMILIVTTIQMYLDMQEATKPKKTRAT